MATVTKPMALDETLQSTNTALGLLGKDASLQAIVTALATIGLNTVGNLAQLTTEQKTSLVAAINELNAGKIDIAEIGVANGIAELDANGKVLSSQLPSFVDDVVEGYYKSDVDRFYEESTYEHVITPESGKSWVDIPSNKSYRWTGSVYVRVDEGVQLGETSDTAYRGDRGKTAYLHATDSARVTTTTAEGLYKVGVTSEGHVSSATAVQKSDITALGVPAQDTTYNDATQSVHGLMSTADKIKLDGVSSNAKKVEESNTNGNIKIDDVETQVYDDTDVQSAISDLGDDVDAIEGELTTDTATVQGNPINFTTKSAQNAKSTILSLEPIQDLHGYDKPWIGGAGKNKWSLGDISQESQSDVAYSLPSGEYTIQCDIVSPQKLSVRFTYADTTSITVRDIHATNSQTFTLTSNCVSINTYISNFSSGTVARHIQIEQGSQATSYAPYENICPISGRSEIGILGCGANIWDRQWEVGVFNQTTGLPESGTSNAYRTKNKIAIEPNKSYIYKSNVAGRFFFYSGIEDIASNYISNTIVNQDTAFTTPQNAHYMNFQASDTIDVSNVTINRQSTDLTISLGQTVYGGTLDVENGVLVVDRILGDKDNFTNFTGPSSGGLRYAEFTSNTIKLDGKIICNMLETKKGTAAWESTTPCIQQSNTGQRIRCYVTETDLNTFKTNYADISYVYELATPITINLTPHTINLLKGVNNISTDGDKITLTYRDGSVATLGDLTSAVDNLDSKIDESKILTDTATGDKYILVVTNGVLSVEQISN